VFKSFNMSRSGRFGITILAEFAVFLVSAFSCQTETNLELLFEKALVLEETQLRFNDAISLYQEIVAKTREKNLGARAQLRIGICLEIQGLKEAQNAYSLVIKNYPDQSQQVAEATKRLDKLNQALSDRKKMGITPVFRQVYIPHNLPTTSGLQLSYDGTQLAFTADGSLWTLPIEGKVDPRIVGSPKRLTEGIDADGPLAWSMNGKWIAFNVLKEGRYLIYRIRGEDGSPEPVPVERDRGPLYQGLRFGLSPDGSEIAYVSMTGSDFEYSVFTAPIEGGASRRIDTGFNTNPSFSPNGRQIAYSKITERTESSIHKSEIWIASDDRNQKIFGIRGSVSPPIWSPDGKRIAVLHYSEEEKRFLVWIIPADETSDNPQKVDIPFSNVQSLIGWIPQDQIAILAHKAPRSAVYTVPVSGGMATQITPYGVIYHPRWSDDGNRIYFRWERGRIGCVPREGGTVELLPGLEENGIVEVTAGGGNDVSPDGSTLVFSGYGPERPIEGVHIYTIPVFGGEPVQLTFGPQQDRFPCWSPDGKKIAFLREFDIWTISAGGGEPSKLTNSHSVDRLPISWSPKGTYVACYSRAKTVQLVPVKGGPSRDIVTVQESARHNELAWSPDGALLAYSDAGKLWIINVNQGYPKEIRTGMSDSISNLDWSPDGKSLVFRATSPVNPELWLMSDFLRASE
jgi:Tol biopolymer transport system component